MFQQPNEKIDPFEGYNDGTDYYFAKDSSGGLVIIDPWLMEEDRTNTNLVIMRVPGVGKSTATVYIPSSLLKLITNVFSPDELTFVHELHNEYSFDQSIDDDNEDYLDG